MNRDVCGLFCLVRNGKGPNFHCILIYLSAAGIDKRYVNSVANLRSSSILFLLPPQINKFHKFNDSNVSYKQAEYIGLYHIGDLSYSRMVRSTTNSACNKTIFLWLKKCKSLFRCYLVSAIRLAWCKFVFLISIASTTPPFVHGCFSIWSKEHWNFRIMNFH